MKDKFIIGGGISGLIFKYYNPDFTIIESKKIGGQINSNIGASIRFVFKNYYTERLLKELKINYRLKKLKIRFFYGSSLYGTVSEKLNYFYLKRKLMNNKLAKCLNSPRQNKDSWYYSIDLKRLIEKLSKNIEIINNKVILIDVKNQDITLANYKKFHYKKLVSTIPAHIFRYIAYNSNMNNKFQYLPGTLVISNKVPSNLESFKDDFDILYYCNDDMIFVRVWKQRDIYIYEIPGNHSLEECKKYFEEMNIPILKHDIQRVNLIFTEKIKSIKNILFLGRLANWQGDYFISDIIESSKKYKEEQKC